MRHRFERVLDVLGEAVIVRDGDSRLVYANEAAGATVRRRPDGAPRPQRRAGLRPLPGDDRSRRPPLALDELPYRRLLAGLDAPPRLVHMGDRRLHDQGDAARRGRAARRLDHRGRHGRLMASYSVNDARRRAGARADRRAPVRPRQRLGRRPAERRGAERLPRAPLLGGLRGLAPRPHRGRQRRDQGALRVRLRRLPPGPPHRR